MMRTRPHVNVFLVSPILLRGRSGSWEHLSTNLLQSHHPFLMRFACLSLHNWLYNQAFFILSLWWHNKLFLFLFLFCLLLSCWVNNKRHQHRAVPIAIFNMTTIHNKLQFYVCAYTYSNCIVRFIFLGLVTFLVTSHLFAFSHDKLNFLSGLFLLLLTFFFVPSDLFTIVPYNGQVFCWMSHFRCKIFNLLISEKLSKKN